MYPTYRCHYCKAVYTSKSEADMHVQEHLTEFHCNDCEVKFDTFSVWQQHKESVHASEISKTMCDKCGLSFVSNSNAFKRHMHQHKGPFLCDICNEPFSSNSAVGSHKKVVHHLTKVVFPCTECPKKYYQKNKFVAHKLSHSKPYICSFCGQRFGYQKYLTQHVRIHTGEKPYKCSSCDVSFAQKTSLDVHNKSHHSRKTDSQFSTDASETLSVLSENVPSNDTYLISTL
ncbi:unnamed protein product [Owenia fusiformis]|uniref:C2H2-type domain-containing protein n=1 Tax=Owenia fusiformis TaxID=6347 RepID=A0A8S4PIA3_OWEFU|nr:unnamed protein product [Owenia fusiformis]